MKKRIFLIFLCLLLVLFCLPVSAEQSEEVQIYANSRAAVYNIQTKTFLYDISGDTRTVAATSTKVCALILLHDYFASQPLTEITVEAAHLKGIGTAVDPSTPMLGLKKGNVYTAQSLIAATCVSWSNDAISPLIHTYCSMNGIEYKEFAQKMTELAKSIGCTDTVYVEPLGMSDMGNYTTAKDIALLCAEFYGRYDLYTASNQGTYLLKGKAEKKDGTLEDTRFTVHTRNYLLSPRIMAGNTHPDANGLFAGQASSRGGYCVATAVESGPLTYITVVTDGCMYLYDEEGVRYFEEGKNPYDDIKTLIEWVKNRFEYVTLCKKGDAVDEIFVEQGKNTDHVVLQAQEKIETIHPKGEDLSSLEVKLTYNTERVYTVADESGATKYAVKAPVKGGEVLGMAEYILNGNLVGKTQLLAADEIDTETAIKFLEKIESALFSPMAVTVLTVVLVLAGLYITYCVIALIVRVVKKVKKDAAATQKEQKLKQLKNKKDNK